LNVLNGGEGDDQLIGGRGDDSDDDSLEDIVESRGAAHDADEGDEESDDARAGSPDRRSKKT